MERRNKGFRLGLFRALVTFISSAVRTIAFIVFGILLALYSLYDFLRGHMGHPVLYALAASAFLNIGAFTAYFKEFRMRKMLERQLAAGSSQDTNELANRVSEQGLKLAQDMIEFLSDKRQDSPKLGTETISLNPSTEELHANWQEGVSASRKYENRVLGGFRDRYLVRLGGVLFKLKAFDVISEEEERNIEWSMGSIYQIDRVPQALISACHRLRSN